MCAGKGKPCVVVDGSGKSGFKRWRKATVQPVYIKPDLTAAELLVSDVIIMSYIATNQ